MFSATMIRPGTQSAGFLVVQPMGEKCFPLCTIYTIDSKLDISKFDQPNIG